MIDKKMGEKQLQIEVSCGNAGNSIDGQLPSASKTSGNDTDSIASGNYDDGGKLFLHYKGQCFMAKCAWPNSYRQVRPISYGQVPGFSI